MNDKNSNIKPIWQPGSKISPPIAMEFHTINPANLTSQDIYRILINTIIPRPNAFVSTQSKNGKNNLAPFSFFNGVSSNPAALMISIGVKSDGTLKDTLRNIEETGEFVVNSANHWLIDPLVYSAGNFPEDIDEMTLTGLTPLASEIVKAPRVQESAFQYECTVYNKMQIGDGSPGSCTMVVGKIERMHIAESIYNQGRINPKDLQPIGRLGGISYTTIGDIFEIAIPKV